MARELQLLAKEFERQAATLMRTNLNLYQTSITTAAAFLHQIATQAQKEKRNK